MSRDESLTMPSRKIHIIVNCIVAIGVIVLCGCTNVIDDIEKDNIERVKNINAEKVKQISIYLYSLQYKYRNNSLIRTLLKNDEISEFVKSLRTMNKVHTNHPQFPNEWYVVVEFYGGNSEELYIRQRKDFENILYVNCIGHGWFGSAAEAESSELYDWMKRNGILPE